MKQLTAYFLIIFMLFLSGCATNEPKPQIIYKYKVIKDTKHVPTYLLTPVKPPKPPKLSKYKGQVREDKIKAYIVNLYYTNHLNSKKITQIRHILRSK